MAQLPRLYGIIWLLVSVGSCLSTLPTCLVISIGNTVHNGDELAWPLGVKNVYKVSRLL